MKLNTLKEMSQNKKIVLYGIAMVVFIIVIIKSFMSTYNAEKTKFLKREDIAKDKEIVAYCRGPFCVLADEAVKILSEQGYNIRRLDEGYPEWKVKQLEMTKI